MKNQTVDPRVAELIGKLLAKADVQKGVSEAEADAFMAKAQKLMAEHNLTLMQVERGSNVSGRREEAMFSGGMYEYQRELWRAVAELNFCLYFRTRKYEVRRGRGRMRAKMRVVGRAINVAATKAMAEYVMQTAERLTKERLGERGIPEGELHQQFFSAWAVAYREGIVDRVISKVRLRRDERTIDEERRQAEADRAGTSTARALTIADVSKAEEDANRDFLHGDGYSAKLAARYAARAAAEAEAEAAETQWAEAHPEKAAAKEAEARAAREAYWKKHRSRWRGGTRSGKDKRQDSGAYWSGYDDGERVGIDPQTEPRERRMIGHGNPR